MELSDKHYLGTLCKRGHQAPQDPTKSLRFKTSKGCVGCSRIQQQPDYVRLKRPALKTKEEQLARHKESVANWRNANKAYFREYNKRPDQVEKSNTRRRAHHAKVRETPELLARRRLYAKAWYSKNKQKVNYNIRKRLASDSSFRDQRNQRKKESLNRRTPEQNLRARLQNRFWLAMRLYSNRKRAIKFKDYNIDWSAIIDHLGPCPGSRKDWHVDHVMPLSKFDLNDYGQVRLAFAPENHQWLPAEENLRKYNKSPS